MENCTSTDNEILWFVDWLESEKQLITLLKCVIIVIIDTSHHRILLLCPDLHGFETLLSMEN